MTLTTLDNLETKFIQIANGKIFDLLNLDQNEVTIEEAAFSLAKINRYTGWTNFSYSVAQHSYYLSKYGPEKLALPLLLHDVHECVTHDLSKPVKDLIGGSYKYFEKRIERWFHSYFNIVIPEEVYRYDLRITIDEKRTLLGKCQRSWGLENTQPLGIKIEEWDWKKAENKFCERYYELKGK